MPKQIVPHKHHDVIMAFAKGYTIQFQNSFGDWIDAEHTPKFLADKEYRVKPKPTIQKWRWLVVERKDNGSIDSWVTTQYYTEKVVREKYSGADVCT